jgi:AcrR family transcriptional regulator
MRRSSTKKPRRSTNEERCARRRDQVLSTATRLFAEHGYSDTDMQLLADTLGVGKGTIYRYFPSKQDLFLSAVDHGMRLLRQRVDESIAGIEDPFDRVARAVRAYLAFFADHPEHVELLIQERAQFKDRKKPTYFEHRDAQAERWRSLYRQMIDAGRLRDVPVERIRGVLGDLVYGTMFTNYFTGRRRSPDEQANDILDIVFHGILSGPERQRRGLG